MGDEAGGGRKRKNRARRAQEEERSQFEKLHGTQAVAFGGQRG